MLVVTASAHRQAAFEAAEFLMDYLKTRAPFWKKETTAAGESAWVDAREEDESAAEALALISIFSNCSINFAVSEVLRVTAR